MGVEKSLPKPLSFEDWEALGAALMRPAALVELALLLACLGLAALIVAQLRRARGPEATPAPVLFGKRIIDGVLFPGLALVLAWGVRAALPWLGLPPALFRVALPLLVSLLMIRLTVRVLSAALPQSRLVRLIEGSVSWLAWGGAILWITGLLPMLLDELDQITFKLGSAHLSLRNLLEGGLTAVLVMVLALWLSSGVEARLLRAGTMDLSLRKIAANALRALLLFIGLLIALSSIGIDLTALGVLGGAIGVGIGLGLQRLAANYVSGFVILAERALRIGDVIRVDGFEGRISDIKTRYTIIRALNGRHAIVPNELLITQRVENASLGGAGVMISTTVLVAGGSDVDALIPQLVEVALQQPRVMAEPGPAVQLSQFAPEGLELTIWFWIADPENGTGGVRSDVNLAILRKLQELNVTIPFVQRWTQYQPPSGNKP
ncbi:mechanosensitive ion channel family protein [Roseateles violae]|uniref:Mechanosensitive ion channel n=1 Tax=Roseateles violae TaxID=3058042 RepID=A0ABT8DT58_9BURK|nr:mechanosensitive ion channel domain-containing protein [Pelomonas sp. PFR6]MDN3920233.1 mechanosensitive ion channel [Pelomonas sp. PFR6]